MVGIKRVYDPVAPDDGRRYLVDRLWPRGVGKDDARLDGWLKDLAPSTELRLWFGHEPAKWREFERLYRAELASPQAAGALATLRREAGQGQVTLLYGAKDREHNHALVLKDVLEAGETPPLAGPDV